MLISRLRIALLASLLTPVVTPGCSVDDGGGRPSDGALEPVSTSAQAVVTYGDWGAFTGGQCVIGVQNFYKGKFGVKLKATGVQPGDVGNCWNLGACMYWVSSIAMPDPGQWIRYDWGSTMPQTYDLVVYPPKPGTSGYGHVASVDHMEGGDAGNFNQLYIMDSNFNGNELKASSIHTFNRQPYGFYRLKSLASCSAHCQGNAVVNAQCQAYDCGAVQSSCVHDGLGPHCVYPGCPGTGDARICDGAGSVVDCHDGAVTGRQDCAGAGQTCSAEGGPHCDAPPRGRLDEAGCESVRGWAQDPSVPGAPIAVHLYFGGPAGDPQAVGLPTTAAAARADLCGPLGSCDHAFAWPTPRSLLDGQPHAVHAYGIDASGGANAPLEASPSSLQCPPPAVPRSAVRRQVTDEASLALWQFSLFQDVAPLAEADRAGTTMLERGPDLSGAPRFVRADDGGEAVWLLDGGQRRLVPGPAAVAAWRATAPASMPAMQLFQIERGPDLTDRPRLVQTEGPAYWLLDDASPPTADPGAAVPAPAAGQPAPAAPTATAPAARGAVVSAPGDEQPVGCTQSRPRAAPGASWVALAAAAAWLGRRSRRGARSTREP